MGQGRAMSDPHPWADSGWTLIVANYEGESCELMAPRPEQGRVAFAVWFDGGETRIQRAWLCGPRGLYEVGCMTGVVVGSNSRLNLDIGGLPL